jgi:hypothetical protein
LVEEASAKATKLVPRAAVSAAEGLAAKDAAPPPATGSRAWDSELHAALGLTDVELPDMSEGTSGASGSGSGSCVSAVIADMVQVLGEIGCDGEVDVITALLEDGMPDDVDSEAVDDDDTAADVAGSAAAPPPAVAEEERPLEGEIGVAVREPWSEFGVKQLPSRVFALLSNDEHIGKLREIGGKSLKASCTAHPAPCHCWVTAPGRLAECERDLVRWLSEGPFCSKGDHQTSAYSTKVSYGMRPQKPAGL